MIHLPKSAAPLVSIIVTGWGDAPHLLGCLEALARVDSVVEREVLVSLNEPSGELLDRLVSDVAGLGHLDWSRVNRGFGQACNAAAARAQGELIVVLNDDTEVERDWLDPLVETLAARPDAGAVGSLCLNPDGTVQEAGSLLWSDGSTSTVVAAGAEGEEGSHWTRRVDYCSGASLMIRKATWERLGGFDDTYFPAYYEDVDLCLRIQELGQVVLFQPGSRVRHLMSASTDGGFKTFLMLRNRARFVERWQSVLGDRMAPAQVGPAQLEEAIWVGMGRPDRVLVVDDRVPVAGMGSGFGRMVDALEDLASAGWAVTFHPMTGVGEGPEADRFRRQGIRVLDGDLEDHLRCPTVHYDVVLVSRPHNFDQVGELVRKTQGSAALVYDAEALYFRRIEGLITLTENPGEKARLRVDADAMRRVEERAFRGADHLICISEVEADLVRGAGATGQVHVVAAGSAERPLTRRGFAERRDMVFVAGWLAGAGSPNVDGLVWFIRWVLPRVRAHVPWARLRISGANPPEEVQRFADLNVRFEGHVPDISDLYDRARVAIAPIRFGAGVKIKTVEAIEHGVPVVCTSVAAEAVDTIGAGALLVADEPDNFAMSLVDMLEDPEAWRAQRDRVLQLRQAWADKNGTSWRSVIEQARGANMTPPQGDLAPRSTGTDS